DRGWLRLRLNGTLERLNRKWLGEDVPRPPLRVAVPQTACGVNDRVLAEMAQRLDLHAEVVPVPLPETLRPALEPERGFDATVVVNELADVIDPEWKRRAPPGHPTGVMARIVAFAPADGLNLDDLSALRGARVGINRQFACLEPVVEARVGGPVDWVRMADDVDMARMLQANQVAAYVVPEEFSRMHATKGLRRVELFDFAEKVVFQRHQQALAAACGEALADMRNDGTLDAILAGSNPHPDGKKRVMFVHSFGGDFSPFYETGRHIVRELSRQQALVEHAYLENASHGAYAAERDQLLASHLRRTHGGTYYDLVIAEDFPALDFVHRHHEQLFYRVPVYAYGVGGSLRAVLEEAPEATGMVEEISAGETFALIRHLHPEMKRLYVVNDHSPSGLALREAIASQIAPLARAAGCVVEHSPNVSLSELLARTRSLDQRTVAFFGTYTTDATTGQTADREAFRGLMERVPTYGVFDRYQRVGQIGGKLVAPAAPGDACMAAINRLLSGAPPTSVPIFDSSADNRWLFSQESLRRHGVTGDLPAGATVTVAEAEPTPGWGLGTPQALALAFALLLTL
ncbi:MAG: hypothetical protein J6333_07825, partial [Planctomycetes bacterium]|nr:hypothetical protein [Planctomycetota bacterium]